MKQPTKKELKKEIEYLKQILNDYEDELELVDKLKLINTAIGFMCGAVVLQVAVLAYLYFA